MHVQILVHHVGEGKLAAHEPSLPAEVPRHEADLVFPGGHCSLFCEVSPLELVHADGLPLNLRQILEVPQVDCYITVDFQVWQLTLLDQIDGLSFAPSQLVLVTCVKGKVLKYQFLSILLVEHLDELFFVLLSNDVPSDLLNRDRRLCSVLGKLLFELLLRDLIVLVLIKHRKYDAFELLVDVDVKNTEHFEELHV